MYANSSEGPEILDPDGAVAYLDTWKNRIDRLAADTRTMTDRLAALRVTAEDADGLAEVDVDSGGVLVGLRFHRQIHRMPPEDIAGVVMEAVGRARRLAEERCGEIVAETMGPDSVAGRAVVERMAAQRRDPVPAGPAYQGGW